MAQLWLDIRRGKKKITKIRVTKNDFWKHLIQILNTSSSSRTLYANKSLLGHPEYEAGRHMLLSGVTGLIQFRPKKVNWLGQGPKANENLAEFEFKPISPGLQTCTHLVNLVLRPPGETQSLHSIFSHDLACYSISNINKGGIWGKHVLIFLNS